MTSGLYPRKSVSLRFALDEVLMPQSTRKQTRNRKIAVEKCLENDERRKMALRPLKEGNATGKLSAIRSVHRRQTDRGTAKSVLNIVEEVKDPSRMLQRFSIVMSEQKPIKSIFNAFASCSVRDCSGPSKNFIAIRRCSGEAYARTNAGRAQKN